MKRLPIITTSEIKTFQRCQRLHHYKYGLGYRPVERPHALSFGSLTHAGLEVWWGTAGNIEAASAAIAKEHANTDLDGYDLIRADVMLAGYHARWIDEPITVLSVEQSFRVPIVHPVSGISHYIELAGKTDAVCSIDGRVYVPEHKTKSEGGDLDYFKALRGDMQVSNYLIAMRSLGHEPGGSLYDILVKPPEPKRATPQESRRYTKAGVLYANQRDQDEAPEDYRERLLGIVCDNPDAYYQRIMVTRTDEDLDAASLDLWHMADAIFASHSRAHHPRTPSACHNFGRQCAFFDVCFGAASLDDSTRFTKLDSPHQELGDIHAIGNAAE